MRVSTKNPFSIIFILPIGFVITLFIGTAELHNANEQKTWDIQTVQGTVTSQEVSYSTDSEGNRKKKCSATITYTFYEGPAKGDHQLRSSNCSWGNGDAATVYYNGDDPFEATLRLASKKKAMVFFGAAGLIFLVMVGVGIFLVKSGRKLLQLFRNKTSRAEDHFASNVSDTARRLSRGEEIWPKSTRAKDSPHSSGVGEGVAEGWYPDPDGEGERYWDGSSWTPLER